jgi:cysteine-rich repeat protein
MTASMRVIFRVLLTVCVLCWMGCGGDCDSEGGKTGSVGGECYPNGTCDAGLECIQGYCVPEAPVPDTSPPEDTAPPPEDTAPPEAVCGNNKKEGSEECDDGNTVSETACTYGTPSCDACNADCSETLMLAGSYCGDGTVDADNETCDDGNTTDGDGCSSSCNIQSCYSLDFDGTDDYVSVPHDSNLDLAGVYTLEAWVFMDGGPSSYLLGKEVGILELSLRGDPRIQIQVAEGQYGHGYPPDFLGKWIHVAGVLKSNGEVAVFLDGISYQPITYPNQGPPFTASVSTEALVIGKRSNNQHYFDGKIHQIRISNTVKYATDFVPEKTLPLENDTVALWRFSEGQGSTVADESGNELDGAINGATWIDSCP